MNYSFHPAAESEHLEQVAFYESRLAGLGARYHAEVERALERACALPDAFPSDNPSGLRRLVLHHFPLTLYFRVVSGAAQVFAVAHHRRRPGYWAARIDK